MSVSRCAAAGPPARPRTVRARFTPSEVPLLTSAPHRLTTLRTVAQTLASLGRGYLGGHAEITSESAPGCRAAAAAERLVVARAVEDALSGGFGIAWESVPSHRSR